MWYDHSPVAVLENDQMKILWDFRIQTDHHLDQIRPDIVVLEKMGKLCSITDVAHLFDSRAAEKEQEKIEHYQDLKQKACVIPVVIGALGTVSKHLKTRVKKIGAPGKIALLKKTYLLGIAKILRTLDTLGSRL